MKNLQILSVVDDLQVTGVEEISGASHTEADWGRRVYRVLRFLYPLENGPTTSHPDV